MASAVTAATLDTKNPFDILNDRLAQEVRAYDPGTQDIQKWTLYEALKHASESGDSLISLMESRRLAYTRTKSFTQRTIEEAQGFAEKVQVFKDLAQAAIPVCTVFTKAITELKQSSTKIDIDKIKADFQKGFPESALKVQETYDKHAAKYEILKGTEAEITRWKLQLDASVTLMDAKFKDYCLSLGLKVPGVFVTTGMWRTTKPVPESLIFKKDAEVLEAAKCGDELSVFLMGVTNKQDLSTHLFSLTRKLNALIDRLGPPQATDRAISPAPPSPSALKPAPVQPLGSPSGEPPVSSTAKPAAPAPTPGSAGGESPASGTPKPPASTLTDSTEGTGSESPASSTAKPPASPTPQEGPTGATTPPRSLTPSPATTPAAPPPTEEESEMSRSLILQQAATPPPNPNDPAAVKSVLVDDAAK